MAWIWVARPLYQPGKMVWKMAIPLLFVGVMPLKKVLLSLDAVVAVAEAAVDVEEGPAAC